MVDQTFVNLALSLSLSAIIVAGYNLYRKASLQRQVRYNRWLVNHGQYQEAPDDLIAMARQDAERAGQESEFDHLLASVRGTHGQCVRLGHLFWISGCLEGSVEDRNEIPSFTPPKLVPNSRP